MDTRSVDRVLAMSGMRTPSSMQVFENGYGSEAGSPALSPRSALASFAAAFPTADRARQDCRPASGMLATIALELELQIAQQRHATKELELQILQAQAQSEARRHSASPSRHRGEENTSKVEPVGTVLKAHPTFTGENPREFTCTFEEALRLHHIPKHRWLAELLLKLEAKHRQWFYSVFPDREDPPSFSDVCEAMEHEFETKWKHAGIWLAYTDPNLGGTVSWPDLPLALELLRGTADRADIPRNIGPNEMRCYILQSQIQHDQTTFNRLAAETEKTEWSETARLAMDRKARAQQEQSGRRSTFLETTPARENFFGGRAEFFVAFLRRQAPAPRTGGTKPGTRVARAAVVDCTHRDRAGSATSPHSAPTSPRTVVSLAGAATPQDHVDAREAQLLVVRDHQEALLAILMGRHTRELRSGVAKGFKPSPGQNLAKFPEYMGGTEADGPANKAEFLRRRDHQLCYACNSTKPQCRDATGKVHRFAFCLHHGPAGSPEAQKYALDHGLSVKGARKRDGSKDH